MKIFEMANATAVSHLVKSVDLERYSYLDDCRMQQISKYMANPTITRNEWTAGRPSRRRSTNYQKKMNQESQSGMTKMSDRVVYGLRNGQRRDGYEWILVLGYGFLSACIEVYLSIYRPGDDGNGMHLCYDFSDLIEWFRVWHTLWSYALVAICYRFIDWNAMFQIVWQNQMSCK